MMIIFTGPNYRSKPMSIGMYSDGTPMVKTDEWYDIVDKADTMLLKVDSLNEFVVAMFLIDSVNSTLDSMGISKVVMPYIPGARQDRSNPTGDVLFTLSSVADMLYHRDLKVVVADPHSSASGSNIDNMVEYPLSNIAKKLWPGYTGIIAPDKGAVGRASAFGKAMGKPVYYGEKKRDVSTGRLSGFSVDVPAGGHYLVVDDICDGGGTFVGLGEEIKRCGAYADLYVTHGIFSKGTTELKKYYKNIYTTDTRSHRDGLEIYTINIVEDMENYRWI